MRRSLERNGMGCICSTYGIRISCHQISATKPEGKRRRGRPKRRWNKMFIWILKRIYTEVNYSSGWGNGRGAISCDCEYGTETVLLDVYWSFKRLLSSQGVVSLSLCLFNIYRSSMVLDVFFDLHLSSPVDLIRTCPMLHTLMHTKWTFLCLSHLLLFLLSVLSLSTYPKRL
jgi:hypothetical protein